MPIPAKYPATFMGQHSVIPFRARATERKPLQSAPHQGTSAATPADSQSSPSNESRKAKVYSLELGYNSQPKDLRTGRQDFAASADDELPAGFTWEAIAKLADAIALEDFELAAQLEGGPSMDEPMQPRSSSTGFQGFLDFARNNPPAQIRLDRLPPLGGLAEHWSNLRLPALPLARSSASEGTRRRTAVLSVAPGGATERRVTTSAPQLELLFGSLSDTEN